jgi:hypothetical protein
MFSISAARFSKVRGLSSGEIETDLSDQAAVQLSRVDLPLAPPMDEDPTVHAKDVQSMRSVVGDPLLHLIAEVDVAI